MFYHVLVVVEPAGDVYNVYAPDLPNCTVVANNEEEAVGLMYAALQPHILLLLEDGSYVPDQQTFAYRDFVAAKDGTSSKRYPFTVLVEQDAEVDGYYHNRAYVPRLPECTADGEDRNEALRAIHAALTDAVSALLAEGAAVPVDNLLTAVLAVDVEVDNVLVMLEWDEAASRVTIYAPDLPDDCRSSGTSREQVEPVVRAKVRQQLIQMRQAGMNIPQPSEPVTHTVQVAGEDHIFWVLTRREGELCTARNAEAGRQLEVSGNQYDGPGGVGMKMQLALEQATLQAVHDGVADLSRYEYGRVYRESEVWSLSQPA